MNSKLRSFLVGCVLGVFGAATGVALATIVGALPYTLTNGSTADATQVMADYNKIITDTNANAAHNGVNSDITALTALSTPITAAQGGTTVYIGGASTGTANAQIVATLVPTGMTLAFGQTACFLAGATNTAATTLAANGLPAKNVFRQSPSGVQALTGGEIVSGGLTCAQYDGTEYVLRTSGYLAPGIGPATSLVAAATTDLGTIASHNVTITGSTGITAFGSTASATYPVYTLKFTGAPLITYNASSMITPGAQDIQTAANDTGTALYLGSGNWQILNFTPALKPPSGAFALAGAAQFTATNNSGTPNSQIDITAGQAVMVDTNGYSKFASSVSLTINAGTTGVNGLDAGSLANSTWYYEYLISNGSLTRGILSTSASAPSPLPTGYTYKALVGEMRTGGAATFFRTRQLGRYVRFQVVAGGTTTSLPQLVAPANTQTRTAVAWSACAPPAASMISFLISGTNQTNSITVLAPNNDVGYGTAVAVTNTVVGMQMNSTPNTFAAFLADIMPESANVYYSSGASASGNTSINCYGWTSAANVS